MPLRIGDEMPELTLTDHQGRPWRVRAAAERGCPLVLILHRHLY